MRLVPEVSVLGQIAVEELQHLN